MFNKSSKNEDTQAPQVGAFEKAIPDAAFHQARDEFYLSVGRSVVGQARLFVGLVLVSVIALIEAIAIYQLFPLKTSEPYVVLVDAMRGDIGHSAANSVKRAVEYNPERPVLERELFNFVERLYAINADYPQLVKDGHISAYAYTRSRAITEFKDFIASEQPYQRQKTTPGLIRGIEKKTISFREDGKLVLVRFKTLERSVDRPVPISRDWLMTLQFVREQPTEKEVLDLNPLGLYVTHFEIVEER